MAENSGADFSSNRTVDTSQNPWEADPSIAGAPLLFQVGPGMSSAFEYTGLPDETTAYQTTAWIGTVLMSSPIVDVVGPDACKFLQSIAVNDFTKLRLTGMRHVVICNERGQLLTDGVCIRIAEDRYRTYWLNPPIEYLASVSGMDVHTEDMTGREYFIQIDGEKSLEILEDAFQTDLHDIKFAKHRLQEVDGMQVQILRLGMSGNLAYEIHGPMTDYADIYNKVWASGQKFGAKRAGQHAYSLFNHTEAGFPNINLHYPLPWFESGEGLAGWCYQNPMKSTYNIARKLTGSVGDDLESRFVTPYDIGLGFLIKLNHEFTGRAVLEKLAANPPRTLATLEWNAEDVGKVFATRLTPGADPAEDISLPLDCPYVENVSRQLMEFRADKVFSGDVYAGITTGRCISYGFNSMISLAWLAPEFAQEGTELSILWGTPGTHQMMVRAKVAHTPYNYKFTRNEDKDVEEIPHRFA